MYGAAIFTALDFNISSVLFDGMYRQDQLTALFKLFIYLVVAFVFLYTRVQHESSEQNSTAKKDKVANDKSFERMHGEYYTLGLFSLLGMMILVSSAHFMSFFLGLEILSLPLYAMVALDRKSALAAEASIKYFVTGAIASGLLLYGFSMIYGVTHSLSFSDIAEKIGMMQGPIAFALTVGLILLYQELCLN